MIRPLAGWLPLALTVASAVGLLWWFGHEPVDPWKRYIDRMAHADNELQRGLKKQRWSR